MFTERQKNILKCIVEEYIRTASAVGSKKIQQLLSDDYSSATIRNDCAFLEESGYLEKQHTSSGRVPSTKGYRFYVDNLMEKTEFYEAKKEIERIFAERSNNVDEILEQTSKIISEMTNLASVVTIRNSQDKLKLSKVELIPLSSENASVIFVLSDGTVQTKVYKLDSISLNELKISINLFNERLIDSAISEIETKVLAIKPILEKQVKKYEFVLQTFVNTILHTESQKTKTVGMQYLLANPEFNDPVKIKQLISIIENATPFKWFESHNNNKKVKTNFAIGLESGINNDDISIIGLEVNENNGKKGALTLFGPKRIEYDKVHDLLVYIEEKIEEKMSEEEVK